jgi:fluoride exporter
MVDEHPELPLDPDLPPSTPPHLNWTGIGVVFAGGVLGTGVRYAVGEVVAPWGSWPAATFCVNVVGAFLLGVLISALRRRGPDIGVRQRLRLFAGTGFLGGFTTYSALVVEIGLLARDGYAWVAVAYASATVVLGFLACVAGIGLASGPRFRGPVPGGSEP